MEKGVELPFTEIFKVYKDQIDSIKSETNSDIYPFNHMQIFDKNFFEFLGAETENMGVETRLPVQDNVKFHNFVIFNVRKVSLIENASILVSELKEIRFFKSRFQGLILSSLRFSRKKKV